MKRAGFVVHAREVDGGALDSGSEQMLWMSGVVGVADATLRLEPATAYAPGKSEHRVGPHRAIPAIQLMWAFCVHGGAAKDVATAWEWWIEREVGAGQRREGGTASPRVRQTVSRRQDRAIHQGIVRCLDVMLEAWRVEGVRVPSAFVEVSTRE